MKILLDKKIYVQLSDLGYILNDFEINVPESVMKTIYEYSNPFIVDESNFNEFIEFTDDDAILFFNKLGYIMNYNNINEMSYNELNEIYYNLIDIRNSLIATYNNLMDKGLDIYDTLIKINVLDFQVESIRDYICYREGNLDIKFPTDVTNKRN